MFNTVVITGASDGLGKSIALQISKKGVKNLILTGRNINKLKTVQSQINNLNTNVDIYNFDLGSLSDTNQFIDTILTKYGTIDCLINNAGLNTEKAIIDDLKIDDLSYMMNVNCISPTLLMQKVIPSMRKNKSGMIVNILSSVCLHSIPEFCGYTASKNAFKAVNDTTRKAVKNDNINVIAVYPGGINSNFRPAERSEYLNPDDLASIIIRNLDLPKNALMQEIVIRPIVEDNY